MCAWLTLIRPLPKALRLLSDCVSNLYLTLLFCLHTLAHMWLLLAKFSHGAYTDEQIKRPERAHVMRQFDVTEQRKADWELVANALQSRDKAYIDSKFVRATSGKVFESTNLATDAALPMVNQFVAGTLRAGTVSVNRVGALSPMAPVGGFKLSDIGCDLSLHSFDKFTALKTTWTKY